MPLGCECDRLPISDEFEVPLFGAAARIAAWLRSKTKLASSATRWLDREARDKEHGEPSGEAEPVEDGVVGGHVVDGELDPVSVVDVLCRFGPESPDSLLLDTGFFSGAVSRRSAGLWPRSCCKGRLPILSLNSASLARFSAAIDRHGAAYSSSSPGMLNAARADTLLLISGLLCSVKF